MKLVYQKLIISAALVGMAAFTSCKDDKEPDFPTRSGELRQMMLVYAVNYNNLQGDLEVNQRQMLDAFKADGSGETALLVYKTIDDSKCGLFSAAINPADGSAHWVLEKEFPRTVTSTNPERISEVMEYTLAQYDTIADKNLIFWGHGTAWTPYSSTHTLRAPSATPVDIPECYGYGGESTDNQKNGDFVNIDDLADAIPDGAFDLIWFDCCYMSNIETAYQLRNKCRWYVAYPTEIAAAGLPYDLVLPHIFSKEKDLAGAARALYDYYNGRTCVTVSVWDMSKIENVAQTASAIYASGPVLPSKNDLLNYSRHNPYYDFGQFTSEYAVANGAASLVPAFDRAMGELIPFALSSERDFNGRKIPQENFSGVNVHYFTGGDSRDDNYYRTLDWYKATR